MPAAARSVTAFHCGTLVIPRGLFFPAEGLGDCLRAYHMPFLAFAVELEDGRAILVDCGVEPEHGPTGIGGVRMAIAGFLARADLRPEWGHARRVASLGITREKIAAVVVTHFDYDHTGGLRAFSGAGAPPVYAMRAEWDYVRSGGGLRERIAGRYNHGDWARLERVIGLDPAPTPEVPVPGGLAEIPEAAGAVALVSLPGHTPGHAGVLVRLGDGRRLLLSGDAAYAAEVITRGWEVGVFPRVFALDLPRMRATLEHLRRWAADEPGMPIVPSHDPTVGARCKDGPVRIAESLAAAAT